MKKHLLLLALATLTLTACHKENKNGLDPEEENTRYYVNTFAYSVMNTYYLWKEEITEGFSNWKYDDEPKAKIKEIRYKDSDGEDIDRWTMLTDDYSSMISSIDGVTTTYGLNYTLYYTDKSHEKVCMVVTYTAEGSPARKAGLKRGDIIMKIGGKEIGIDNYVDLITNGFHNAASCTLTLQDGSTVTMTAVEMYEDPVLLYKTFSFNNKKVGYLVYNSFTLDSWKRLLEACKYFKSEGISELILDLRYNSGGYVTAEYTLASMLAPRSVVESQAVFEKSIYNSLLQKAYGNTDVKFRDSFSFTRNGKECTYSTADANVGISKMYVLFTSGSASASESLIVGLKPYLDIEIIGKNSSGKYCSGILYPASAWATDNKKLIESNDMDLETVQKYTDNWGIYVMVSRFADVNGQTPCMPDGFAPDIEASDNPTEGLELGDENESLLRIALTQAGKTDFEPTKARAPLATSLAPVEVSGGSANAYRIFRPEDLPVTVSYPQQYPESQK